MGKKQLLIIMNTLLSRIQGARMPYHAWNLIFGGQHSKQFFIAADAALKNNRQVDKFAIAFASIFNKESYDYKDLYFETTRVENIVNLVMSRDGKEIITVYFRLDAPVMQIAIGDVHVYFTAGTEVITGTVFNSNGTAALSQWSDTEYSYGDFEGDVYQTIYVLSGDSTTVTSYDIVAHNAKFESAVSVGYAKKDKALHAVISYDDDGGSEQVCLNPMERAVTRTLDGKHQQPALMLDSNFGFKSFDGF